MSALQRLAMYEIERLGQRDTLGEADYAHAEFCWEALSHITYLVDRETPPPAIAAALAKIDLQEVA